MAGHILKPFDKDLQKVRSNVITMMRMVRQELADTLQALSDRDQNEASDARAADDLINASERIIDELVVRSIVLHQPMASDCRELIAALRIARDLERIGDYATNIANHSSTLDQLKTTGEEQAVVQMGEAVLVMMDHLIEAYDERNKTLADTIRADDEAIDKQYTAIFSRLLQRNLKTPNLAASCTHLTFIARSLERIGDHITDIAEEILYIVSGTFPEDDRIKADTTAFIKD